VKRVLIVAYYFPPAGGIGSLRVQGFARHLSEFGWEPVVLAPRNPAYHQDEEAARIDVEVVRTGSFELSRVGKRVLRTGGDETSAAEVQGLRQSLQRAARGVLYYPDAQIGWYPPAVRAGRRALRSRPFDAILSTSFPITAHIVARQLHRASDVPWVADFRDPWSLRLPEDTMQRRRAQRLECRLAGEAARAITVSPSWARLFAQHWGREVDVLPNGHDLGEGWRPASPGAELVAGYLGTYYPGTQDLTAVWAALAKLDEPLRVRAIGAPNAAFASQLDTAGLGDRLDVTGFVGPRTVLDELARCSVLLLAGPTESDPLSDGVVAGKVWEYLASGLPILYVGDQRSDIAAILRSESGCALHTVSDTEGIARSLRQLHGHTFERDSSATSRRARSRALAELLDAAIR